MKIMVLTSLQLDVWQGIPVSFFAEFCKHKISTLIKHTKDSKVGCWSLNATKLYPQGTHTSGSVISVHSCENLLEHACALWKDMCLRYIQNRTHVGVEFLSSHAHWNILSKKVPKPFLHKVANLLASHAGVFRGTRLSSLPTNACSTEDKIPFPSLANHLVLSKFWKADLDRRVT